MFIGDGAKLVRDAFQLAKEKSLCIILLMKLMQLAQSVLIGKPQFRIIVSSASNPYCIAGLSLVF